MFARLTAWFWDVELQETSPPLVLVPCTGDAASSPDSFSVGDKHGKVTEDCSRRTVLRHRPSAGCGRFPWPRPLGGGVFCSHVLHKGY